MPGTELCHVGNCPGVNVVLNSFILANCGEAISKEIGNLIKER